MAKVYNIDDDKSKNDFLAPLYKAIQSANLNFLIGSGCSWPAIEPIGNIEKDIQTMVDTNETQKAENTIFGFLKPFLEVTKNLRNSQSDTIKGTLENYKTFLENITHGLLERASTILPKQLTIFSTNYDLFIEKAFEEIETPVKISDGFNRSHLLTGSFRFSSSEYFNSIYNRGTLYNYQVQIPSINLIKLHGSLSWRTMGNDIIFSVNHLDELLIESETIAKNKTSCAIEEFNKKFSVILPTKDKFKDTVLNLTHYDLLRIYANELDKENTLLISEGFSFADEHILKITKRALKNPSLKIIIFCYEKNILDDYKEKFAPFCNVEIVYSESGTIGFAQFNSIMKEILYPVRTPATKPQQDAQHE